MNAIERIWATYEFRPVDHLYRREFYIWEEALARWKAEGMPPGADPAGLFGFDERGACGVYGLGWCEPAFVPALEAKVIESASDYEIVRDSAGRTVKFFTGRRHGFMPTYLKHAVSGEKDWEEDVLPLLDPQTPARWEGFQKIGQEAAADQAAGMKVTQHGIGGYMYLRALIGPEEVCLMLVDKPQLVHRMMEAWLRLAEAVTARFQQYLRFDELLLAEDICYNHGLLISPDMVREFLLPYYRQLLTSMSRRQDRPVKYFQVDSDGYCGEMIDVYRAAGMNALTPFEVAAGNDVVAIARKYPDLIMYGGIDKRVLAEGPEAIDEYLNRVIPFMVRRGGYVPTCDHGVPDNVSYASYMHFRRRMLELDH